MPARPTAALALLLLTLPACSPPAPPTSSAEAKSPTVTVTVATVETRTVQRAVTAVGTLTGYDEVMLAPKVDGRVLKVHRDVGDRVYPGDVVLEVDPVDLQLEVDTARRALESDLARVGLTEVPVPTATDPLGGFDPERVPAVARASLVLANARVEQRRVSKLAVTASISQREADLAELDLRTAEVGHKDALTLALAGLAGARLRQSQLETAEQRLRDAVICAPVPVVFGAWAAAVGPAFVPLSYAVAGRMVSEGQVLRATPVTDVIRLVIDEALKLRANVPESYAAEVRVGQTVQLQVDAYPGRDFTGQVTRINPTIDPQTRTFTAEVSIPNFDRRLKAGGFARARIMTRTEEVRTVPPAALVNFAGVTKVFTVVEGHAKAVEVRPGNRDRDWVEVTTPLPAGTTVCTSGFSQLIEGSPVVVRQ
jgi:multidrug efflux pump subunit AcrA (membrane-fusion protein)